MQIALEYGGTIISADSRQIYRGFDIGTAKPGHAEMSVVAHRGIDVADPDERYSASAWATAAVGWIKEAREARRAPMVVGGTGFYIRALFEPLFDAPVLDAERRQRLQEWMAALGIVELRRYCRTLDPAKAHLGRVQLSRAIETALLAGHSLTELQQRSPMRKTPALAPHYLVVDPGNHLASRIEKRVNAMLAAGWEDEVRSLMAHVPEGAPAWKASGYRVMRELVQGTADLSSARARIIIETRQYAKRQRTWLRHQLGTASVTRVDPEDPGSAAVVERWWKEIS